MRRRFRILLSPLLGAWLLVGLGDWPVHAAPATVVSVGDGDTLRVRKAGKTITIRLACIDAPESSQKPHGAQASQALKALVPIGSGVDLRIKTNDFMTTYAEYLIEKEIPSNLTAGIRRRYKLLNTSGPNSGNLTNRNITQFVGFLNDLEFLYFSNENIIKEYAKKEIIMSMHSAASGRGYLIASSSRFAQGKLYLSKLQSAVTVKVGH